MLFRSDREHDRAAQHDLEHRLQERRVHVARADEGDRPQLEEHHDPGNRGRDPERVRPGRSEDSKPAEQLSAREREVLVLISQGLSDAAIGKRLRRSPNTVRNHVASLYRKLGVHRRTDAVIWGRENGYIARK